MIQLHDVNPSTVQFVLSSIQPQQASDLLAVFTEALTRTGQNPGLYYTQAAVPASAAPDVIAQHAPAAASPAYPNGDWARMVHPKVLAQLTVDLAERHGLPVPDNVFVYENDDWQRLTNVQPSAVRPTAPPQAAPVAPTVLQAPQPTTPQAPLQQPQAAEPYPQPTPISAQHYTPPAAVEFAPEDTVEDAQFAPSIPTGPLQAPLQAVAPSAASLAAQPAVQTGPIGTGEFGLPAPTMAASKGSSPFEKDPGGEAPKAAPARQVRDIVEMLPHLFASPAGDVVGKGNGAVQRLRVYLAALYLVDTALASVPDPNCPVGYLRHHLAHLRYHASQSPAGPTMLAFERWIATTEKEAS